MANPGSPTVTLLDAPDPDRLDLEPLARSWLRSLRARNVSLNTQRIYRRAAMDLTEFIQTFVPDPDDPDARPAPTTLEGAKTGLHREHIEAYMEHVLERTSPGNAHQHFRTLRTWFTWLVDEEEMDRSPMRTLKPPQLPQVEVPIIPDEDIKALLKACAGKDFAARRDTAIVMMFLDTGGRLAEVTERRQAALDLNINVLHVMGKGSRERPAPFGKATAVAMDRYLRAAAKYMGRPLEPTDPLWFTVKRREAMTVWGMGKMLKRRCALAGIEPIHPHQFRHTFAHLWKLHNGNEDALMRIMGWSSREMLSRYGSSAGQARARQQHNELSPGDRLG
ncbi:tyrosine-type recombinase/integrase [Streptomyces sp. MI02-7b]|uniref:tyrosine-type recombinase/integrase n=1 Tax=Streptomyces sp. MI02-7b TaxID=462941 RepID=UPI0029AFAD34|nr:tyrosine-type recombinase/integrase [Streptomyces sp. MI02-7b]MDX3074575.1 tyrosine-type recombinase/integrase [Streptomyces sp. MI02-7b]